MPFSRPLGAVIESRGNLKGCEEAVNRLCGPDEPVPIRQNSRLEVLIHTILSAVVPPGANAEGRRPKSGRAEFARPEGGQKGVNGDLQS